MYVLKYLTGRDTGPTPKITNTDAGYHDGADMATMMANAMRELAAPLAASAVDPKEVSRQVKVLLSGMRRSRAAASEREELAIELVALVLAATGRQGGDPGVLKITLPLISLCSDATGLVQALVKRVVAEHGSGAGGALAETVVARMCRASKVTPADAQLKPHRVKWPKDVGMAPEELVEAYLGGTPLAALLMLPVAVTVSDRTRSEHCLIVGGAGAGKSQTLGHIIAQDIARPAGAEAGMVIIDPTGELVDKVKRRACFAGTDRLVIIDAADEHAVAMNIFDLGGGAAALSAHEQEAETSAKVQLATWIVGGLFGGEFTAKQQTTFQFLCLLMINMGGSLSTLRDVLELEEPARFADEIAKLPEIPRRFLAGEFMSKSFAPTRKQVLARLYAVLGGNPIFARMFGAGKSTVDVSAALNAGKIILVNTSRDVLGEESRTLARFIVALTLRAAFARAKQKAQDRRPSWLLIDEAADVVDDNIGVLLAQARKYSLGCTLAFQDMAQIPVHLRPIVLANTGMKMAAGLSSSSARALADDMQTTPEFLLCQQKGADASSFGTFVRNVTTSGAVGVRIPFFTLDRMPEMSPAELAAQTARNRKALCG